MLAQLESSTNAEKTASGWFTPGRFAALLALLLAACFPLVIVGLRTFGYLDFGQFAYPVAFYHREAIWRGELPFWNPLSNCGMPFLAQWNTLTLYPLSLLYVALPFPWSLGLFSLLHLWLAGLGMYFLAHRWTGNRFAATVAGTIFAFNGLSWYGLIWPHITAALACMPWVVLAMEAAWQRGGRCIIWAGLAAAMQLLSGGAEVVILTWLLLAVIWAGEAFGALSTTGPAGISALRLTRRAAAVGLLAGSLAAVQLLPFFDLLAHSQRAAGYADPAMGVMPLTGWANYLVPIFRSLLNPQGLYVPPNHWTASWYLGVGTVLFALLALWRARTTRLWLMAGLALFSLVLAFGGQTPLYGLVIRLVPPLGLIRFPVKFVILATFIIPLLAAHGVAWLQALPADRWTAEWSKLKILTFSLLGVIAALLWCASQYPLEPGHFPATVFNALTRGVFLVAAVGAFAALRRKTGWKMQRLLQTTFVLLLWLDVLTHNSNLSPTLSPAVMQPDVIRQYFKWRNDLAPGASRLMQSTDSYRKMLSAGFRNLELDTNGRRLAQFFDYNLLDHAPKFDGFYSLDLKEFSDLFEQVYHGTNRAELLKDFLAISRISNPANIVDWVPRPSALPMITAGQQPVFVGPSETVRELLSDNFDPRRFVYLPFEAKPKLRATVAPKAKIISSRFSSQRVRCEVETFAPTMVVIAQSFYHPWHAYLDGKPTPLWRANYAFQALEVPSGKHELTLAYEDHIFTWGAVLSVAALGLCCLARPWSNRPSFALGRSALR